MKASEFRKSILCLILLCGIFTSVTAQWPNCGNWNNFRGYPAGCISQVDDLCVVQDAECLQLLCGNNRANIGNAYRDCNGVCEDAAQDAVIVRDGYTCHCMQFSPRQCSFNEEEDFSSLESGRSHWRNMLIAGASPLQNNRAEGWWGARVESTDWPLIPIFCSREPGNSVPCVLGLSSCQQGPCNRGECYFRESEACYFVKTNTVLGPPDEPVDPGACLSDDALPLALDTVLERQLVSSLFSESSTRSRWTLWTSGKYPRTEENGIWVDWDYEIDPQVVTIPREPLTIDTFLIMIVEDSGEAQWYENLNTPVVPYSVICKRDLRVSSSSTDPDTTIEVTTTTDTTDTTTTTTTTDTTDTTTTTTTTTTDTTTDTTSTTETTLNTDDANTTITMSEEITTTGVTSTTPPPSLCGCNGTGSYEENWCCNRSTTCNQTCSSIIEGSSGSAVWTCGADGQFNNRTPFYNCSSQWVGDLEEQINNNEISSEELLNNLDTNVNEDNLYADEMDEVVTFAGVSMDLLIANENPNDTVSARLEVRDETARNSTSIIYRLTHFEKQWNEFQDKEQDRVNLGVQMLETIESLGFAVTELARELPNPYFTTAGDSLSYMESQFLTHTYGTVKGPLIKFPTNEIGTSIELRDSKTFDEGDRVKLESVGNIFPLNFSELIYPPRRNMYNDDKKRLNSEVVSLTLLKNTMNVTQFMDEAIAVTYLYEIEAFGPNKSNPHYNKCFLKTVRSGTEECAFWNASKIFDNGNIGMWDTSGCRTISRNRTHLQCTCNHLSSLAVLVDIHEYGEPSVAMTIVSIVFSSLSIVCLIITFLVLQFLKAVKGERTSISKHVCLLLAIGHLLSLNLDDQDMTCVEPDGLCVALGVVTHYVFLAAFMWMGIEGYHLYRLVIHVFDSGRDLSWHYVGIAYGVPLIIVGTTLAVGYGTNDVPYGNDRVCWLSTPNYIWAFIAPLLVITTANLIVMILAMRVAVTSRTQQHKSFVDKTKVLLRGWFSLAMLLGVSWLFGFLYLLIDDSLVFVFIILSGLQGVFIFLYRIVFNKQVRAALIQSAEKRSLLTKFYSKSANSSNPWVSATSTSSQMARHTNNYYNQHYMRPASYLEDYRAPAVLVNPPRSTGPYDAVYMRHAAAGNAPRSNLY